LFYLDTMLPYESLLVTKDKRGKWHFIWWWIQEQEETSTKTCMSLQKHAKGLDLLKRVCEHLNLLEEDYFGLAIWDNGTSKVRRQCII
jgi:hypothetical protein